MLMGANFCMFKCFLLNTLVYVFNIVHLVCTDCNFQVVQIFKHFSMPEGSPGMFELGTQYLYCLSHFSLQIRIQMSAIGLAYCQIWIL